MQFAILIILLDRICRK